MTISVDRDGDRGGRGAPERRLRQGAGRDRVGGDADQRDGEEDDREVLAVAGERQRREQRPGDAVGASATAKRWVQPRASSFSRLDRRGSAGRRRSPPCWRCRPEPPRRWRSGAGTQSSRNRARMTSSAGTAQHAERRESTYSSSSWRSKSARVPELEVSFWRASNTAFASCAAARAPSASGRRQTMGPAQAAWGGTRVTR